MKKIFILLVLLIPNVVFAVSLPETYSNKVLIYDLTEDKILQEKGLTERANIASLTKIMTTITAIEKNPELSKQVTITEDMLTGIPWDASVAGIKVGETFSIMDLLYASILPSGADATQALAISSSGSVKSFVEDMNTLAKKIGTKDTFFVNVTGYDVDNHYSNLEDLLTIIKYALKNKTFKKIFETREYTLSNSKIVYSTLIGYNKQMGLDTSRIIGSKTGFTAKAGVCIAATIKSSDHDMLIITLGAPYVYGNFYNLRDALSLTKFIDDNYNYQSVVKKGDIVKTLPVELSEIESYSIHAKYDVKKFLPVDYDKGKLDITFKGEDTLSFRDIKGNTIGELEYYYDGELLSKEKITLEEEIKVDVLKVIKHYGIPLGIVLLIFIAFCILLSLIKKIIKKRRKKDVKK